MNSYEHVTATRDIGMTRYEKLDLGIKLSLLGCGAFVSFYYFISLAVTLAASLSGK